MAVKKYVSLDKLNLYDEKIKKVIADGDAASLASAKAYAESLAVNYDAAGSAATVQGKLDEEVLRAKAREDEIAGLAATAQSEVDALETLVGTLPEGTTATSVVDYVNVKTAGIATDAALSELNSQVSGLQTTVQGITADYLKAADKTELSDAIKAEESRAKGIEGGLETRLAAVESDYLKAADMETLQGSIDAVAEDVAAIEEDYLKAADKTELEGKINAKADQTALDAEKERAEGVEASLQTQINTIMNNPDAEGAINSINEFTAYVSEHGTIADGMRTDINKNKDDIAAEVERAGEAESALSGRLDALEAIDHEAYVSADTALKNELTTEIGKKADSATVTAQGEAIAALQGEDTAIKGRLDAVEAQLGDGEGSVADLIAEAKQEAIDTAASDATSKANAAQTAAEGHADSLNTAMNARVEALEAIDHEHSNKALLDSYTQTEANLADAVAKKHEHSNMAVLEGVTAAKVSAWDASEGNAKTYADGLNTTMSGRMDAVEAWQTNMIEVSEAEINALFTA